MKTSKRLPIIIAAMLCPTLLFNHALASKPHSHAAYQKPGAPIRLADTEPLTLDPYTSKRFSVTLETPRQGELILSGKPKAGISVSGLDGEQRFDLSAGPVTLSLEVTAEAAGHYHFMLHGRLDNQARVFGIPIEVGDVVVAQQKSDAPYVILPAQETISQ